jgi:hypothetical protein
MARGPNAFKQQDIKRACLGVKAAGLAVSKVEVGKDGKIAVFTGTTEPADELPAGEHNEWDGE